jgi:hypothetical protein
MYGIARPRAAGKTHELMVMFLTHKDTFLLVRSENEKARLVGLYNLSRDDADRVVSWNYAQQKLAGRHGDILVDNVDDLLREYFHRNPVAVSFTGRAL